MAKLLFGPITTAGTGKIAGTVLGKNAEGYYARRHTSPSAKSTAASAATKNALSATAHSWITTLTTAQRAAWIAAASQITVTDRFGNPCKLTGQAYFIRVNANIASINSTTKLQGTPANIPLLANPPSDQVVTDPGSITITNVGSTTPDLQISSTNNPQSGECALICANAPQSMGRSTFSAKRVTKLQAIWPTAPAPWDVTTAYTNKYLSIPAYKAIVFSLYYVRTTNGAKSKIYPAVYYPI